MAGVTLEWIEYGFKQIKNELGWADYRVTDYDHIERWWERCSAIPCQFE